MLFPLFVTTPLSDKLETDVFFPFCPILVEGRELLADLVLLDVLEFYVILGMDWLARHYASLDCREKVVIFIIPNDDEFRLEATKLQCLKTSYLQSQLVKCSEGVFRVT